MAINASARLGLFVAVVSLYLSVGVFLVCRSARAVVSCAQIVVWCWCWSLAFGVCFGRSACAVVSFCLVVVFWLVAFLRLGFGV